MTSTSASLQACAIASQPLISASVSCGMTKVSALMLGVLLPLQRGNFLVVLASMMETMRPMFDGFRRGDLLLQPSFVDLSVLFPHLILTAVVSEGGLVHHGDALFHRAHGLAHAAAAAGLHVGIIQMLGGDIEAGIGTLQPAQGALDAFIEIDHRPHRARRVLLKVRIALWLITAFLTSEAFAHRDAFHHDGFLHLPVLGLFIVFNRRRIPFMWEHAAGDGALEGL